MPDFLHNYFVRYQRAFLVRGVLALVALTGFLGWQYIQQGAFKLPLPGVVGMYAFFGSFILIGLFYRGLTPR